MAPGLPNWLEAMPLHYGQHPHCRERRKLLTHSATRTRCAEILRDGLAPLEPGLDAQPDGVFDKLKSFFFCVARRGSAW